MAVTSTIPGASPSLMRPPLACSNPATSSIRLVLPEPEGPTMPNDSRAVTLRFSPFRILTGPASLASVRRRSAMSIMKSSSILSRRTLLAALAGIALASPLRSGTLQQAWAADPVKVLALGDSLTAGYGLKQGEGFADQ